MWYWVVSTIWQHPSKFRPLPCLRRATAFPSIFIARGTSNGVQINSPFIDIFSSGQSSIHHPPLKDINFRRDDFITSCCNERKLKEGEWEYMCSIKLITEKIHHIKLLWFNWILTRGRSSSLIGQSDYWEYLLDFVLSNRRSKKSCRFWRFFLALKIYLVTSYNLNY